MKHMMQSLLLVVLLGFPAYSYGQLWSGVLDPSRAIDWSQAGVVGGIPNRTTTCVTLNPGVTSSQINSAIAGCPSGGVVFLSPGTYNLSGGIVFANKSNVTLRGAGPTLTHLNFTGSVSCNGLDASICVRSSTYLEPTAPANSTNWTAGYSKGTTTLTFGTTAGLNVGSLVILNQLNDPSDTGNIFVCSAQPACSNGSFGGGGLPGSREQLQFVTVTAINGNQVTVSPGLYMPNWRSARSPQAWWLSSVAGGNGIENLDLNYSSANSKAGILLMYVSNSWVKNVKSTVAGRSHVWFWETAHSTVRDSYFYNSKSHASQSYGVEVLMGSDNLIENNIAHRITAPYMVTGAAPGTVIGHNYSFNDEYTNTSWMQSSSYQHATGISYVLHEGNEGTGFIADNVHGPSAFITAFRNQWYGWEPGKTAQTVPIHIYTLNRYFNVIGNVLGQKSYHIQYESTPPSGSNCNLSIYALGWGGNCSGGGGSNPPDDSLVSVTTMRWGNYDTVTSSIRWDAKEVPSSISPYGNGVPINQTLPKSFYLSAKPPWWGSMPWPAIGPDVAGGDIVNTNGHAWRNPARVCYDSTAKDSNGVLDFDGSSCYGGSGGDTSPPDPPNNLSVK